VYLGTGIPRHEKRFDTLICALHYLISYVIMSRPLPVEEMTRRSVYGPARLLSGDNFSERVVALLEQGYLGTKPENPRIKNLQTTLSEFASSINPGIIRLYQTDDLVAEGLIRAHLILKQMDDITDSEIGEVMTKLIKERA
jgi:hypothetical protein